MSPSERRVALTPGYVLHHRPWRDTSRILEVLTREHGRLTLFARGVRGAKAKLAAELQPFQLLLLSWSGRGEAPQLTGAERAAAAAALPQACLLAAFYLKRVTAWGAVAAIATGTVVTLAWDAEAVRDLFPAIIAQRDAIFPALFAALIAMLFSLAGKLAQAADLPDYEQQIKPILTQYCFDCHANGEKNGNVAFDEMETPEQLLG